MFQEGDWVVRTRGLEAFFPDEAVERSKEIYEIKDFIEMANAPYVLVKIVEGKARRKDLIIPIRIEHLDIYAFA